MSDSIYVDAVAHYGRQNQMLVAGGELAELITAISDYNRGRISSDELCSEIADASIMINQVIVMAGITREQLELWDEKKKQKLLEHMKRDSGQSKQHQKP